MGLYASPASEYASSKYPSARGMSRSRLMLQRESECQGCREIMMCQVLWGNECNRRYGRKVPRLRGEGML